MRAETHSPSGTGAPFERVNHPPAQRMRMVGRHAFLPGERVFPKLSSDRQGACLHPSLRPRRCGNPASRASPHFRLARMEDQDIVDLWPLSAAYPNHDPLDDAHRPSAPAASRQAHRNRVQHVGQVVVRIDRVAHIAVYTVGTRTPDTLLIGPRRLAQSGPNRLRSTFSTPSSPRDMFQLNIYSKRTLNSIPPFSGLLRRVDVPEQSPQPNGLQDNGQCDRTISGGASKSPTRVSIRT